MSSNLKTWFVPTTPAGTPCFWLKSRTRKKAIKKLLKHAAHMPWNGFEARGYTIEKWKEWKK